MFENLFNEDNVVWRVIGVVGDIVMLNIVFVFCCIPIITIGASVTALYTVALKQVKYKSDFSIKLFFQAFRNNFKQSTIIWLIMLAVGALLVVDWYLANVAALSFAWILNYVFMFLGFCYLMILSYVFPIQSKFENKISATIMNSAMMGVAHFLPWTLLIMLLNILPFFMICITINAHVVVVPIMFLGGFVIIAYINSLMFQRFFIKYIPED